MALTLPLPQFDHLTIEEADGATVRITFDPPRSMTLGSPDIAATLSNGVTRALRSIEGYQVHGEDLRTPAPLVITIPRNCTDHLIAALPKIQKVWDAEASRALGPWEVERALRCTTTERKRWLLDGRLKTNGTGEFKKYGTWYTFDYIARASVIAATPEVVAQWRDDHKSSVAQARSDGAKRAAGTRKVRQQARHAERLRIDDLARSVASQLGDMQALALCKLALYTQLANRHAKAFQERDRRAEKERFYQLKDRALRVIATSPWVSVFYVPSSEPKVFADLCDHHLSEFREERRFLQCNVGEWITDNSARLLKCKQCDCEVDEDYYSLYEIHLKAGDVTMCWHVPHGIGSSYLPDPDTLPHLKEEPWDEGLYRYGRAISEDEAILHPPAEVEREITALLALWDPKEAKAAKVA